VAPQPDAVCVIPRLLVAALASSPTAFVLAVSWRGQTAMRIALPIGCALLSFDQVALLWTRAR